MLRRVVLLALSALALVCFVGAPAIAQQQTEPRIAFVVGNAGYAAGAIPTALNDAGLVAEALRSIGFQIVEGADLSQADIVRSYREFLAKVEASGPDTLAFVYFSGHALSFDGENFLLGVDARLERESDIPIESVRLSDLLRPLAASPARAKVMMIDAARPLPFRPQGRALAHGLEAIDPPQGVLMAYSSAPGTVAPDQPGDYGAYATAIAEMLRAPGTDLDTAFTHIRSRTHQTTEGRQTPWHASALGESIELVPPEAATASVPPPPPIRQARPMREIGPDEAYALAIEMDTLEGYTGFVQAYPGHPYTQRVWAMIRARREALAWMRAEEINTPQSYWTYLRRYPNGMYAFDAERRLGRLGQPFAPPPGFIMIEFDDVPIALADEPIEYEEVYRVGPPPPLGLYGMPRPAYLVNLPPPERRRGGGAMRVLPALAVAIPAIAALAPAPRRALTPGAVGPGRPGGFGGRGGNRTPPAPANLTPNTAVAPSAVSPSPGAPPSAPRGNRPPGWGPAPGGAQPPGVAGRTPPGTAPNAAIAPSAVAPSPAAPGNVTPSPRGPATPGAGRLPGRPPGGGPPPGIANRTPPGTPGAIAPNSAGPNTAGPGSQPPAGVGRPLGRPPGGPPPGIANRTPPGAPGAVVPNSAAPGNQPPPGAVRQFGRPPGGGPPPGVANRTPPGAPGAVAPNSVAPSNQPPPGAARQYGRPPGGGPPPGFVNRTPPSGPPPQVAPPPRAPGPPPQQMYRPPPQPAPIARPTPPAAPMARPAPPPPPPAAAMRAPAPAPAARPPACPPGKNFVNGACR